MSLSSKGEPRVMLFGLLLLSVVTFAGLRVSTVEHENPSIVGSDSTMQPIADVYDRLGLGEMGLSRKAFDFALLGMDKLSCAGVLHNNRILSIIDFSLSSCKKRLFVLDLVSGKMLFNSLVSHGRNSGKEMATTFSNANESFQSSLGFYVTGDTYNGEHGLSLRLLGEEQGINDNALTRGIVMHCAAYVNEALIKSQGYIGRSLGCPALPEGLHKSIIDQIKNGTCLFLYSPDKTYLSRSKFVTAG